MISTCPSKMNMEINHLWKLLDNNQTMVMSILLLNEGGWYDLDNKEWKFLEDLMLVVFTKYNLDDFLSID